MTKPEQEQMKTVREKIKIELKIFGCQWDLIGETDPEEIVEDCLDQILSLPEIAVLHPEQWLPKNDMEYWIYDTAQQDMLSQNWRRVIKR